MANQQLRDSWKRTVTFLIEARALVSLAAEASAAREIALFHDFIDHNELELALDALEGV